MFEERDYDLISNNIAEFISIFLDRVSFGCDDKITARQKVLLRTCRDLFGDYAMTYGGRFIDGEAEDIIKDIGEYIKIIRS